MSDVIIFTAINEYELAEDLVVDLLEADLIRSGTIFPEVKLYYKWEGSINIDDEIKIMLKTDEANYRKIEQFLAKRHHYLSPEIIKINAEFGSAKFKEFVKQKFERSR